MCFVGPRMLIGNLATFSEQVHQTFRSPFSRKKEKTKTTTTRKTTYTVPGLCLSIVNNTTRYHSAQSHGLGFCTNEMLHSFSVLLVCIHEECTILLTRKKKVLPVPATGYITTPPCEGTRYNVSPSMCTLGVLLPQARMVPTGMYICAPCV